MSSRWPVLFVLCLFCPQSLAQEKPKPGDEMIYKYLCAETDKLSQKFMDGAKTLEEWQQKRPRLYQEYMDMLGLWPVPEKTPLKAAVTGSVEAHGVVVEKVHFQSKPGLYVTANLYRPRTLNGKRLPAIVYVCGHSGKGRDGNKSAFQDHGFWFANNGYVCIVLDTLQLGEIPGVHHGTYGRTTAHFKSWGIDVKPETEARMWWHSAGYTPAGVECWNGVRAIDYLVSRPDVDADKIGVTGISGGGAATFWIACADDRVKVAVPVSGMSDLESYVMNKVVNGHCDCMFLHNTYQWDWTTIAALVAPRPMLFANSDNDKIFPMDGNRRIIAKLRTLYKMHNKPDLVDDYVSVGGHDYRPDLRVAIFKFINKHLKGDAKSPVEDSEKYTPLPGKELRVFATDEDLPKDRINDRIDETFVPRAKVVLPAKGKFEEWKKQVIRQLAARSLRNLENASAKDLRESSPSSMNPLFPLVTEPGIEILKELVLTGVKPEVKDWKGASGATYILSDQTAQEKGFAIRTAPDWAIPHCDWSNAWVLHLRCMGNAPQWTIKSPPNFVERSQVLCGRTTDQGRVLDILAAVRQYNQYLEKSGYKNNVFRLVGQRQLGILAAYAALFEPSIKEVIVIDPPKSHMEGPHFLNVLRVLDIPEALGLLAPRPLTIIGGKDAAFDRTAEIYRLAGAADKLVRK